MKTARKQQIVLAYVRATKGRLPTDLNKLLADMRERIGDVTEGEVRASIKWALREPRPPKRTSMIISQENLEQEHQLLILVGGRELPRQPDETEAQILARRGTLMSLDARTFEGEWRVVCVMPYMADF
jgi:hypothetical protein